MGTESVIHKAISGDREALTELLIAEGPAARAAIQADLPRRWQSVLSADDVMQQTYTDAFLSICRFVPRGDGAFRAWLIRLAKRNLLDAVRMLSAEKRGGNRAAVGGGVSGESLAALYEMMEASISTPSGGAARAESRHALQDAIEKLPPEYAKVVRLYDLEGLPVDRVAAELKRSVGAVYMLRARAHERLSELMGSPSQFFTNA